MIRKREAEIILTAAIIILTVATPVVVNAQDEVKINWLIENNPSFFYDISFSTCEKDVYVYAVGFDYSTEIGSPQLRVEKRLKSDGSLVKNWTHKSSDYGGLLYDCIVIGEKLYAVGTSYTVNDSNWILLVLDLDLNLLNYVNLTETPGAAISAISDQDFLYVAGVTTSETSWGIYIEKIRLSDLNVVKEYVSSILEFQEAYCIGINPVSNQIWVVGNTDSQKWRIEILDKELTQIKNMELEVGASAISVDFDEKGDSYVAGEGGIVKLSKDGEEIKRYVQPAIFAKTLFLNNRLYVAGGENVGNYARQVLYVFDRELNLLNRTVVSQGIDADAVFLTGRMTSDEENLYISGLAYAGYSDYEWVVCSIKVGGAPWYLKNWYLIAIPLTMIIIIITIYFFFRMRKTRLEQPSEATQSSAVESGQPSETASPSNN
jgi:hypothetical protein